MASHHTGGDAAFRTKLVARPEADDVGAVSSLSIPRTRQHALSARNAKRRHSSDALGGAACRKSAKRESNIFQLFVGRASHVRLKLTHYCTGYVSGIVLELIRIRIRMPIPYRIEGPSHSEALCNLGLDPYSVSVFRIVLWGSFGFGGIV